jgi:hypothetical protein
MTVIIIIFFGWCYLLSSELEKEECFYLYFFLFPLIVQTHLSFNQNHLTKIISNNEYNLPGIFLLNVLFVFKAMEMKHLSP